MTPAIRKYHYRLWFFLAGFLPLLFVAAIVVIPERQPDPQFSSYQPAALPELMTSASSEHFTIRLLTARADSLRQLEILVKKPLTAPAALVYISAKMNAATGESVLLGELSSVGEYRFNLGEAQHFTQTFVRLFDPIKNQVIQDFEL